VPTLSPAVENTAVGIHPPSYRLPAQTRIGLVRLAVSNLERSIAFYGGVIGLAVLERTERSARLGTAANGTILELEEQAAVRPLGRKWWPARSISKSARIPIAAVQNFRRTPSWQATAHFGM